MIFADGIVFVRENLEEVNTSLNEWRSAHEEKGLKLVEVEKCITK